jgi:SAM-dependent methyltransferase
MTDAPTSLVATTLGMQKVSSVNAPLRLDPDREEAELREYLGSNYDRRNLENYQGILDAEVASAADEKELYRTSNAYLYNLTAFAMTGTKLPYLEVLMAAVPPGARLLDYGCGIGSDGLVLIEAGYQVEFADFANPSTAYLRWRLDHRGLDAPIHDIDGTVPGGFDLAYAFDVIEHVPDPFAFLHEMESRAGAVEVNFLEFDPNEQELHYELPIKDLLRHAAGMTLRTYKVFHGTSHLVVYSTAAAGSAQRARNQAVLASERVRRRVKR